MLKFYSKIIIALLALLSLSFLPAFSAAAKTVTVSGFIGTVEYRIGTGKWQTVNVDDQLPETAEIRILAANDSVDLILPDNSHSTIVGPSKSTLVASLIAAAKKPGVYTISKKNIFQTRSANAAVRGSGQGGNNTNTSGEIFIETLVGNVEGRIGEEDWTNLTINTIIPEGSELRINGGQDYAVLSMSDGSSIKILGLTSIQISNILSLNDQNKKVSWFKLLAGKVFAKVQKSPNQDFRIETASAVAAVRGTMFGVSFNPGEGGSVLVADGSVSVSDIGGQFASVLVKAGFKTVISDQPGIAPQSPQAATAADLLEYGEGNTSGNQQAKTNENPTETSPGEKNGPEFNWSLSGENIDGSIWNKVLLSPTLNFGNFSIAFYLPFYFKNLDDVFAPKNWYNYNEWDFTSFPDGIHDLMLKIRYMQFQNEFVLFKLGNIPSITIGHGALVDGYANDLMFPAVRKIGFQLNVDAKTFGFESMMGDIFSPLAGGRFYVRPWYGTPLIGNLGMGISGFADFTPVTNSTNTAFGYGTDLDLPFVKSDVFGATLYADGATLGYITPDKTSVSKGLGLFTGIKGNILVLDYRLEYRRSQGGFILNYVDRFYDIQKAQKFALLTSDSFTNPDANGWLLEAGTTFSGMGGIKMNYQQYYPAIESTNTYNFFHMEASIDKNLFKKAYGSIAYDRQNFGFNDLFTSFLGNGAVITTQAFYEVAESAYIGITYKKYFETDATGTVTSKYTFALQTQMGL